MEVAVRLRIRKERIPVCRQLTTAMNDAHVMSGILGYSTEARRIRGQRSASRGSDIMIFQVPLAPEDLALIATLRRTRLY
jgi:hypothetical protein